MISGVRAIFSSLFLFSSSFGSSLSSIFFLFLFLKIPITENKNKKAPKLIKPIGIHVSVGALGTFG
ncbi:MAG: hypothetical protein CL678_03445 [Bdellovibrionaceae bacterium]|nr:hypothetical protein [Pseudobdellovibrionaceae bacterium]